MDAPDPLGALADRLESEWYGTAPAAYERDYLAELVELVHRVVAANEDT